MVRGIQQFLGNSATKHSTDRGLTLRKSSDGFVETTSYMTAMNRQET